MENGGSELDFRRFDVTASASSVHRLLSSSTFGV